MVYIQIFIIYYQVAEKNSIAEAVAYALGNKVKAKKGRQAFYYYSDKFKG